MNRFGDLWSKVEKYVIYTLGAIFVVLPILEKLFGWQINQNYVLFLLGLIILFVFRYIDKNINLQRQSDISPVTKFTSDIGEILAQKKKINKLCIFAESSFKYYQAISENKPQINELYLLVRNFDDLEKVGFPPDPNVKQRYKERGDNTLTEWLKLKEDKNYIKDLIIHRYSFDSFLHFMLVDDSVAHFGLLKPLKDFPGSEVLPSFRVSNESESGRALIANFADEFKTIFENFSEKYVK